MSSSKKEFWAKIHSVNCPECGKPYQHHLFMISHMCSKHDYPWDKAKETVDSLGIYCPVTYRSRFSANLNIR